MCVWIVSNVKLVKKLFLVAYNTMMEYDVKRKVFVNVVANVVLIAVVSVVALAVFGGGVISVFSENKNAPIYRGNGENCVSLMINVYWGNEYLEEMLQILAKYGVKCTFFVGGSWVAKYPELLKAIADGGHEIGNHGYNHKEHSKLTYLQNSDEILACNRIILATIGVKPTLFMPPSGDFGENTIKSVEDCNMKMIMWSRDTIDWRDKNEQVIYERCTKNIRSGELILMHPTLCTKNVMERVIKFHIQNGNRIVTVGENIAVTL